MSAIEQTAQWVDALWGSRLGWATVAYGNGPHRSPDGKYAHRTWTPHWYRWPDQRRALLADITRELATDAVDIYAAPHLRGTQSRKKHTALLPMWLHADIDGNVGDPEVWNLLNPIRVRSGSAGHEHGYIALTRALELTTWDLLQRALRDRLGGDTDSKIADNDVLRLPGTLNFKPTVPPDGSEPGEPAPVVLLPGGGRAWEPEELTELLVSTLACRTQPATATSRTSDRSSPCRSPQYCPVRSRRCWNGTGTTWTGLRYGRRRSACAAGRRLSCEETFAVACAHVPGGVKKYDGPLVTEFDRSWGKALDYWTEQGGLTHEAAEEIRRIYADDPASLEILLGETAVPSTNAAASAQEWATDDELDTFLVSFTRYQDPARASVVREGVRLMP